MEFKRTIRKYSGSKIITVPKDLIIGEEYVFELKGFANESE